MDMEYGDMAESLKRVIKDTTVWIRSQAMECTNGIMDGFIRETLIMILEMDLGSFMTAEKWCTEGFGIMASRLTSKLRMQLHRRTECLKIVVPVRL